MSVSTSRSSPNAERSSSPNEDPPQPTSSTVPSSRAARAQYGAMIADDSVDVVVDKGTLDALHGEEDKLKMMRECARVVKKNAGVVVSVSFASAARVEFLRRVADALRMDLKLAVIGGGDPKFGNLVHFVSVLGFHLKRDVPEFSQPDDELTRTVARRVARARSVIEDEPPSADDALTLFDASDDEDEAG